MLGHQTSVRNLSSRLTLGSRNLSLRLVLGVWVGHKTSVHNVPENQERPYGSKKDMNGMNLSTDHPQIFGHRTSVRNLSSRLTLGVNNPSSCLTLAVRVWRKTSVHNASKTQRPEPLW